MHLHIVKKHMIGNEEQLDIYRNGIAKINATRELIGQKGLAASLAVKLSVPKSVQENPELFARVQDAMREMPPQVFQIYDPYCIGPGVSTRMAYFNEAFSAPRGIVVDTDYDQVNLHTLEGLEAVSELAKKTERDGALFAIGSRNVPVVLGTHESNSNLRIIHEGVHSIAVGPEKLRAANPPVGVTPMYAALGESTSGVMMMNQTHPQYATLAQDMHAATKDADMNGFATNYFITIRAAQLGDIVTGWALYDVNYYPSNKTQEQEREGIEKMIAYQTAQLAKIDAPVLGRTYSNEEWCKKGRVGNAITNVLGSPRTLPTLATFYPEEQVEDVLRIMAKSFGYEWCKDKAMHPLDWHFGFI